MLALRLPAEIEDRLDTLANMTGRTKSFYAKEAILKHLDALENLYLSEQHLIDVKREAAADALASQRLEGYEPDDRLAVCFELHAQGKMTLDEIQRHIMTRFENFTSENVN